MIIWQELENNPEVQSKARVTVGVESVITNFDHLADSLQDGPLHNMLNYEESNFSDDSVYKLMVIG